MKNDIFELIKIYDEYISLFEEENKSLIGMNIAHGYEGNEEHYKKGIEIRAKIAELKKKLGYI